MTRISFAFAATLLAGTALVQGSGSALAQAMPGNTAPGAASNAPMPGVSSSTGVTPGMGVVDRNTGAAAASGDRNHAVAMTGATALPAMAQQNQGGTVPLNREETVPLQLKAGQVMAMQQRLNERGFSAGRVDGLWGPDTSAAVRSFQQKNGLPRTGQLDQGTLRALGIIGAAAASSTVASPAAAPPAMPDQDAIAAPAPSSPPGSAAGRAASGTPSGAVTTGTNPGAPAASAPDATSGNAPGNAFGRATDRTLGTDTTGTNPGGGNAGQNAAGGDRNQAVATTDANAPQPAHGANSFSQGEARRRIERQGFQNISGLRKDNDGVWRGTATKDGQQAHVWLDYKGSVGQQ